MGGYSSTASTGPGDCLTLKGLIETSPQFFSRAAQLLSQFGWDVVPSVGSGVTFLIPADTAFDAFFAKFDPATAQALLLNKQALEALAAYHIVPEAMRTTQMSEGQQLKTLAKDAQGNTLSLTVHRGSAGGVGISLQAVGSTARLLVPDVPICGGYAQVIDQVLLPVAVNATTPPPGAATAPAPTPSGSAASG